MSSEETPIDDQETMTFWEHLDELRSRLVKAVIALIIGGIVAWIFREEILLFLIEPFKDAWAEANLPGEAKFIATTPTANFLAYIKLAIFGGFVLALPVILYQFWAFISPGLHSKERRLAIPFVLSSMVLFCGGALFGWLLAFSTAFKFLLGMGGEIEGGGFQVEATWTIGSYFSFVTRLLVAFGLVFELPVVILFLSFIGLVDHRKLIKFSRYFIVIAFLAAAILSPPDVASQLFIAVPLCVLYGISIGLSYFVTRARERNESADEDEDTDALKKSDD